MVFTRSHFALLIEYMTDFLPSLDGKLLEDWGNVSFSHISHLPGAFLKHNALCRQGASKWFLIKERKRGKEVGRKGRKKGGKKNLPFS